MMNIRLALQLITIAVFVFLSCLPSAAQLSSQTPNNLLILEQGVTPHKGLDEIYRRFSEGYQKLDASAVANLYSETAAYLVPGDNVRIGRPKVLETFNSFFDSIKRANEKLEISFRIVQRQSDKNLAYDVGIYTLTSTDSKGSQNKGTGKFVVVAKRENKDVWRFQVDGYSGLPTEQK